MPSPLSALIAAVLLGVPAAGITAQAIDSAIATDTPTAAVYSFQEVVGLVQVECGAGCTPAQYQVDIANEAASANDAALIDTNGVLTFTVQTSCTQFDTTTELYPEAASVTPC